MPLHIDKPTRVTAAGNKPKLIDEYVGRASSRTDAVSVAHMRSPGGWAEPGQAPEFDEYSVVLKGMLRVQTKSVTHDVYAGGRGPGVLIRHELPGMTPSCLGLAERVRSQG